ncbi:hypothetical protein Tco_0111573 [Tanacetum coccineum]
MRMLLPMMEDERHPIHVGRPYHTLTARKSVGLLTTLRLASRHSSESSSSNSFFRHSSSGYAISDSLDDSLAASSVMPYRKRCRSSTSSVPAVLPDGYEPYVPREAGLGFDVKDSYEPYTETNIDSDIQADIDECITYDDAIRAKQMDDIDVVKTTVEEDVESRERETWLRLRLTRSKGTDDRDVVETTIK